jgi:chromosomal replication initiator protein
MDAFWRICLSQFEKELPPQQFITWIKPLAVAPTADADGSSLAAITLVAPNRFVLQWVRDKFLPRIKTIALDHFGKPVNVELLLREKDTLTHASTALQGVAAMAKANESAALSPAVVPVASRVPQLPRDLARVNPAFTFDAFVTGNTNDLACAAAKQVSEKPGTAYNPLFIYGGVGLGKTHLIHAIGNYYRQHHPHGKVRYIHAESYVSDVVRAYQHKAFDDFKRYYHTLDLLLIDDIQFISGKSRTQEEFFYAFNALIESHKQIVITCDTYPKEITGLENRLVSRFGWGLTVAIEPPELEMRVAILNKKADQDGIKLDAEVAFFLAKHVQSNVRELEGALKRVLAYANFAHRDITLDLCRDALRDLLAVQHRQISIENIQRTVAEYYKIKVSEMYSKKRSRNVARPRQVAMALAKELTQLSLPDIGDAFGGRDHTTVLHACRKISDLRSSDGDISRDVTSLLKVLRC